MKRFWKGATAWYRMVRLKCLLFEETLARVPRACKKNFLFYWRNRSSTGRSCSKGDQRLTQVSFSFLEKKFLWIILSVIFKSVRSSTCWQNEAFTSEFKFRTYPYLNPALNNPTQVLLKANRKFSCPTGQANTGYWLCTKMLCIIVPNRRTASPEFFLWVRTWWLLTCLAHAPKKCTQSGNFQFDINYPFQNTVYSKTKDAFPKIQAWAYNRYSRLHRSRLRLF